MLLKQLQQLIAQVQERIPCGNCRKIYGESEITIIGAIQNEVHLHLKCSKCGSQSMVNATIDKYSENRRHRGLKVRNLDKPLFEEITTDDVIEMHDFLENFQGNFKEIF